VRNRTLLLFLSLSLTATLLAQDPQLNVWRIEVRGAALAVQGAEYTAVLEDTHHQRVADAALHPDNSFEFRDIAFGDYWLTISDRQGGTIYQGLITAHSGAWQETLDLPSARETERPPAGPVSVADLLHPPSRKAFAALAAAQRLSEAGQFAAAAEQLEKATRLSPDWPDAHTNLAAQYIRLGRYDDAISEAGRAIALSKPNGRDLGNLAFAEYRLNRRAEAIQSAREGLAIEPSSPKLHYILGALLAMNRATLAESIPHLELAARTLPSAQATLDQARQALISLASSSAGLRSQR
jgi:tetratricopeptide (TPR) repeat protein